MKFLALIPLLPLVTALPRLFHTFRQSVDNCPCSPVDIVCRAFYPGLCKFSTGADADTTSCPCFPSDHSCRALFHCNEQTDSNIEVTPAAGTPAVMSGECPCSAFDIACRLTGPCSMVTKSEIAGMNGQKVLAASLVESEVVARVTANIGSLTRFSADLKVKIDGLGLTNIYLLPTFLAEFTGNFIAAIGSLTKYIASINEPLSEEDSRIVINALVEFAGVQRALLQAFINKRSIGGGFLLVPFLGVIRQALIALERAVDAFVTVVLRIIAVGLRGEVQAGFEGLRVSFRLAINAYTY